MAETKLKQISVGKDGSVWAVGQADGTIFRLYGDAGILGWIPDKGSKAEVVAAVNWGRVWCVNKGHEIWHLADAESLDKGGTWTRFPTHSGKADAATALLAQQIGLNTLVSMGDHRGTPWLMRIDSSGPVLYTAYAYSKQQLPSTSTAHDYCDWLGRSPGSLSKPRGK